MRGEASDCCSRGCELRYVCVCLCVTVRKAVRFNLKGRGFFADVKKETKSTRKMANLRDVCDRVVVLFLHQCVYLNAFNI